MDPNSKSYFSVQVVTVETILDIAEQLAETSAYNHQNCKDDLSLAIETFGLQEFIAGWEYARKELS